MELYTPDLKALVTLLDHLDKITCDVPDIFALEFRVRFDDTLEWAVIGWGESGDPCVLRFERDPAPVVPLALRPGVVTFNPSPSVIDFNRANGIKEWDDV